MSDMGGLPPNQIPTLPHPPNTKVDFLVHYTKPRLQAQIDDLSISALWSDQNNIIARREMKHEQLGGKEMMHPYRLQQLQN